MSNLNIINNKFLEANSNKDNLEVLDSQFDGEQYFLTTRQTVSDEFSFMAHPKDFKEYFPNLQDDSLHRFRFGYTFKIVIGLGFNFEDGNFIYDKNPNLHYFKFITIRSRDEEITDDEFKKYIEDITETQEVIIDDNAEYLTMYNNFSIN